MNGNAIIDVDSTRKIMIVKGASAYGDRSGG